MYPSYPVMNRDAGRTKVQQMGGQNRKFVKFDFVTPSRVHNDTESEKGSEAESFRKSFSFERTSSSVKRGWEKGSSSIKNFGRSLKSPFSRGFVEERHVSGKRVLDPRSSFVILWNKLFVMSCLVAVFLDPLFFYLPVVDGNNVCVKIQTTLAIVVTVLRSFTDTFYLINMLFHFRTAFIAPSSRVFGRGELVTDPKQIATRYLKKNFWLDCLAVLPIPQVTWVVLPLLNGELPNSSKNALRILVLVLYIPRLVRIFPLTSHIVKTTGVVMETAWAGAAFNLLMYMLASHFIGACWYFLAVDRQNTCWRLFCDRQPDGVPCHTAYFTCRSVANDPQRALWLSNESISATCSNGSVFNYGIYINALTNNITTSQKFLDKYFYCLWFGLLNLSSLAQDLSVSTYFWEILFTIAIIIFGLVLFALLIGNMQTYLASLTVRLEEMRVKRRDTELWMKHRQLPSELRERVRKYDQYKWVSTRGVDEGYLLQSLPLDLRRDIKQHLCLDLVRRVPLFDEMDERLLDAICERLKPALNTPQTYIIREGDPVKEMLFIIRGHLDSVTTNGGRTGFFNFGSLGPGDFCGEELLTWALDPKPSISFPSSTRTVKTLVEVEAFALEAEDLKFVASQFRRLHSKQLQHTFRYYSHQWRTWAACFIQVAWRRYLRRRMELPKLQQEEFAFQETNSSQTRAGSLSASLGATFYASRFAANAMRGVHRLRNLHAAELSSRMANIPKPSEPDFSVEDD